MPNGRLFEKGIPIKDVNFDQFEMKKLLGNLKIDKLGDRRMDFTFSETTIKLFAKQLTKPKISKLFNDYY